MTSSFSVIVPLAVLLFTASGKTLGQQKLSPNGECPPEDDIYPCNCISYPYATSVDCEKVHDLEQVKGILKNTEGFNLSIAFWSSRLGDIPSDLFSGQIFDSVHFENCRIGSFGEKPFSGLEETLTSLYIYGSVDKRRKDLETFPLGHLKKLKYLSFLANDIKNVGNEWFQGGPSTLEQLSLEANDIEVLGDKAFAALHNLQQIWLGDNRFGVVSRSMFPKPAKNLEILEMSFDGIEIMPEDLFIDMPSLHVVNVAGNKLQTLEEKVWSNSWRQLTEVYVDRNPLVCDGNLKWIYKTKLPSIFDGKCGGQNSLRGKLLEELTLDDFE